MNAPIALIMAFFALVFGALFSALHLSLRGMASVALEELASTRRDAAAARRVEAILADPPGHATAIALPRVVCNLLVVVGILMWVTRFPSGDARDTQLAHVLFTAVVGTALIWMVGAVIPGAIADHVAERTVYRWSRLIRGVYIVLLPLVRVTKVFDAWMRQAAGRNGQGGADAVQAELLSAVEEAEREGAVDEIERDMIEGVVRFKDTTVKTIMTPRTEAEALELTNDLGKLIRLVRDGGHSRIPVYQDDLDHIVGIFYVKDLMRWLAGDGMRSGKGFDLKAILRPALVVPETKTVRELLEDFLSRKVHIAVVADEYGGTAGLVTMEDIIEEVFGDIWDEYERPEDEIPAADVDVDRRQAEIDARMRITDANIALRELDAELPESDEYDTVGGLVLSQLGHFPEIGEELQLGGVRVTVLKAEPTRVLRVRVEVSPPAGETESSDDEARVDEGSGGAGGAGGAGSAGASGEQAERPAARMN